MKFCNIGTISKIIKPRPDESPLEFSSVFIKPNYVFKDDLHCYERTLEKIYRQKGSEGENSFTSQVNWRLKNLQVLSMLEKEL